MRLYDWRRAALRGLKEANCLSPERDIRAFLAEVLNVAADRVSLLEDHELVAEDHLKLDDMLARRLVGVPRSRILGFQWFWSRKFQILDAVLDPRAETESVIARALEIGGTRILDLGTGSGVLAVTYLAEQSDATGVATDLSPDALKIAATNADIHGVSSRLKLLRSNWFAALDDEDGFDLILSNPPYIAQDELATLDLAVRDFDPLMALSPGKDGLSAYREILSQAMRFLRPGGAMLLEIGWRQGDEVKRIAGEAGYDRIAILPDLAGRPRVLEVVRPC